MNKWRDRFWDLFHILKSQEVYNDQLMLLIDTDISSKLRKYDGFINDKREEQLKRRQEIDALVLGLPQGE